MASGPRLATGRNAFAVLTAAATPCSSAAAPTSRSVRAPVIRVPPSAVDVRRWTSAVRFDRTLTDRDPF
ncbi:hypothetical protein GCM10020369_50560 [Cryptosporangium minutisporangium]|uniref:Secreted protein n=1 Tax=Cryptosporangium minutisporangium TaxID=113569 RepID=A0ABP6T2R2_9ACTN